MLITITPVTRKRRIKYKGGHAMEGGIFLVEEHFSVEKNVVTLECPSERHVCMESMPWERASQEGDHTWKGSTPGDGIFLEENNAE